jgi:hypothetical protein
MHRKPPIETHVHVLLQVCRPGRAALGLRLLNSTHAAMVWGWMQTRGSAPYGIARAYHSLLPATKVARRPVQHLDAYEHMLLAGAGQL